MYSKDELLSKDVTELAKIASELGVTFNQKDSQEDIIYAILDKQAIEEGNRNPLSAKRKRTRIVKKDTDRVYTVKRARTSIQRKASQQLLNRNRFLRTKSLPRKKFPTLKNFWLLCRNIVAESRRKNLN